MRLTCVKGSGGCEAIDEIPCVANEVSSGCGIVISRSEVGEDGIEYVVDDFLRRLNSFASIAVDCRAVKGSGSRAGAAFGVDV